jgi:hypothetical protein
MPARYILQPRLVFINIKAQLDIMAHLEKQMAQEKGTNKNE